MADDITNNFNRLRSRFITMKNAVKADSLVAGMTVIDRHGVIFHVLKISPARRRITVQALHPMTLEPQNAPERLDTKSLRRCAVTGQHLVFWY